MSGDDETRTLWPRSWWEAVTEEQPTPAKPHGAPGRTIETAQLWPRHPSFIVSDIVTGAESNAPTLRALIDCLRFSIEARKHAHAGEFASDARSALAYQRAQLEHADRCAQDETPEQLARVRQALDQLADLETAAAPWLALAPDDAEEADRLAWIARLDRADAIAAAAGRSRRADDTGGRLIDASARFRARARTGRGDR